MKNKFLKGAALGAIVGAALEIFFNPSTGRKNRAKFGKAAKEVSTKLSNEAAKFGAIGKKEYEAIVDNVIKKYDKDDLLSAEAWEEIAKELKARWADVQKEIKKAKIKK
ncbi:MAG: YtxH domain-containing protein [Parcubacteria group bacterium]